MSINIYFDRVEVFKFRESGLAALCEEAADFIRSDEPAGYGVDVDRAYFAQDSRSLSVVFPAKDR